MSTITIGIDLAKSVFSTCAVDGHGHVLDRKDLKRDAFVLWLAQIPAGTVVAMEACSGAHHWARRCQEHGLELRMIATQFVTPFRKNRTAKNGRQMAAWLGLVPMQHSTGGHTRLGRISCRGDGYLRTLLIQGARSSLQRAKAVATEKATPEQLWIRDLDRRMPFGKVLVAIANKHARQIWAMLAHEVNYDPCASVHHPMQHKRSAA